MKIEVELTIKGLESISQILSNFMELKQVSNQVKPNKPEPLVVTKEKIEYLGFKEELNPSLLSEEELSKRIINMIYLCKNNLGINQAELGDRIGVHQTTITQYAKGTMRKKRIMVKIFKDIQNIILINTKLGS